MVEYIKIKETNIRYPVGKYMFSAKSTALQYSKAIKKVFLEREGLEKSVARINLIGTGSSGAILCTLVSLKIDKFFNQVNVIHIKKPGEKSHYDNSSNYMMDYINIFVDDFMESGATIERVYKELKEKTNFKEFNMICTSTTYRRLVNKDKEDELLKNVYKIIENTEFVTYRGNK